MKTLDHVGVAVADIEAAIREYETNFGFTLELREELPDHGVRVAFLNLGNTSIELLSPLGNAGALQKFMDSHGPGLHHVCYRVEDIKLELKRLEGSGVRLIDKVPRPGARHTLVAFLHPKSLGGVLTEICQYIG